jgi:VanZ family protein
MSFNNSNRFKRFLIYHLPFIIYGCLIILISSIPNLRQPQIKFLAVDKIAHFIEYAILAFLIFRSFTHISAKLTVNHALTFSLLFLGVFAMLDEFYQRYIPGRHFDIYDLVIDILGGSLVLLFLRLRLRNIKDTRA